MTRCDADLTDNENRTTENGKRAQPFLAASVPLSEFPLSDHIFEALKEAETKVNQLKDTVNRRFLPIQAVKERTGLSKATIYRAMNAGTFPRPVPVSASSVRWLSSEIDDWMDQRIAAREVSS